MPCQLNQSRNSPGRASLESLSASRGQPGREVWEPIRHYRTDLAELDEKEQEDELLLSLLRNALIHDPMTTAAAIDLLQDTSDEDLATFLAHLSTLWQEGEVRPTHQQPATFHPA